MAVTQDSVFTHRRELEPPVGLVADFVDTPVVNPEYAQLWAEPNMLDLAMQDEIPLPAALDRESYYGPRHLEYWLSGLSDCRKIEASLGNRARERMTVLDFGGCTGRATRHFVNKYPGWRYLISEINVNYVDWVQRYFPRNTLALLNPGCPPLPLKDASLDLIMSFSVFTHLDKYELPWLAELARVLKPDGLASVTICNEDTWDLLPRNEWLVQGLSTSPEFVDAYEQRVLPGERCAFYYSEADLYNCNTFFTNAYIHDAWGRLFRSITIRPLQHGHQTVVLLRDPV
jgi:SAM-dependent methyltransferase